MKLYIIAVCFFVQKSMSEIDKVHQTPNWLIEQLPSKPLGQQKLLGYKKSQDRHPIPKTTR